jgi:hypothetical protein
MRRATSGPRNPVARGTPGVDFHGVSKFINFPAHMREVAGARKTGRPVRRGNLKFLRGASGAGEAAAARNLGIRDTAPARETPHSRNPRYIGVVHVTIHMKKPDATVWDSVGNFSGTEEEISELRQLLEGRRSPFEVMGEITNQLIWDTLDIIKSDGYQARIEFHTDQ